MFARPHLKQIAGYIPFWRAALAGAALWTLLWFAGLWAPADADPIGIYLILLYGLFLLVRHGRGATVELVTWRRGLLGLPAPEVLRETDLPTDDWPFFYLRERGLPGVYLWAMAAVGGFVILLMLGLARGMAAEGGLALKAAFVLMGAAFVLIETKSIVQFSLLFGTTWLNTSLVLLAVLALVLAANWTALLFRSRRLLPLASALLAVSVLLPLLLPLSGLLRIESVPLRFLLAALMTFTPVYFANLVFSTIFRDQAVPERLFGWNLLGAVLGGVAEYASLAVGYNALAWAIAVLYVSAFSLVFLTEKEGSS